MQRVGHFVFLILAASILCGSKVSGRTTRDSLARDRDGSYTGHGNSVLYHESKSSLPKTYSGWNLSLLTYTRQLDAWRDRVARAFVESRFFEDEKPVRVFVSHGRWMTRTSAPSTLLPDGSLSISNCSVPCAVEFNRDEKRGEQPLSYSDSFDWTRWTTSASVRAADVVVQVDLPWDEGQLRQLRAWHPRKRAVFASWEPLGTAYRTASAMSERRYDWLASFTFSGENAADVPSTYEGLDHSDAAVAEYYEKRRQRSVESADADGFPFRGREKWGSMSTRTAGRKWTGGAAVSVHTASPLGAVSPHKAAALGAGRAHTTALGIVDNRMSRNRLDKSKSNKAKDSSFCRGVTSPVFMAVSNCAAGQRQRLLSAFMEVLPVDSYGNCLRNSKLGSEFLPGCAALPGTDWREQKECLMSCYPFVLSIESTHSELDYATEKLFDPLMHDSVIPIYLGPPNEREFLPHPSAAVLVRDFSAKKRGSDTDAGNVTDDAVVDEETMRKVARYVASVSRNASAMQQLRSWRAELDRRRGGEADDSKRRNKVTKGSDDFPFQLRSWFSHRRFFCNLCTRYAAESVGISGYNIVT